MAERARATRKATTKAAGKSGSASASKKSGGKSAGKAAKSVAKRTGASAKGGKSAEGASREEKAITRAASGKRTRSAADLEKIRVALITRRDELRAEHEQTLTDIADLQRERLTDSAGDDQADTGTKTFEREQEISLANNILDRITQVERALERVAEGNYGNCERCGNPIPVDRLAAFPSATLCISCKQLEERR